jgi:hypothetical protein
MNKVQELAKYFRHVTCIAVAPNQHSILCKCSFYLLATAYFSTLKMWAVRSSEKSVIYQNTWHRFPEDIHFIVDRLEIFKCNGKIRLLFHNKRCCHFDHLVHNFIFSYSVMKSLTFPPGIYIFAL